MPLIKIKKFTAVYSTLPNAFQGCNERRLLKGIRASRPVPPTLPNIVLIVAIVGVFISFSDAVTLTSFPSSFLRNWLLVKDSNPRFVRQMK